MLQIEEEKLERGSFWTMNVAMALNNFETIVKRAFAVLGKSVEIDKIGDLEKRLNELKSQELIYQARIERVFFRSLPHLHKYRQYIEMGGEKSGSKDDEKSENQPISRDFKSNDLFAILKYYAKSLYELRDYFAHSEHHFPRLPEDLGNQTFPFPSSLENAFFNANVRAARTRFYPGDPNTIKKGLDCLYAKNKTGANPNFRFSLREKNDANGKYYPTRAGLAFFIARFLEKRYVDLLFEPEEKTGQPILSLFKPKDFGGFEFSSAPRRVYGIGAARLPRRRVETSARPESSSETLGLDIIGFLTRCPKSVYELLSESDRRKFRVASDETNPSEGLRTRSEKRFPRLAALCLDRLERLDDLRFQIDMGQYFSAVHRRRLIDGTTIDDRRVGKRIFWFERIQNAVERYRAERLQPNSKYFVPQDEGETPPETDYRVDAYPRYRIKNQQLGLRLVNPQKNLPPKLIPWEHAATRGTRGKTKTLPPEFWLSQYELPSLLFVALHGKGKDARNVVVEHGKNWRRFLEDVRDGRFEFGGGRPLSETRRAFENEYRLRFEDLPDSIRALFASTTSDVKKAAPTSDATESVAAEELIGRRLEETRARLRVLDSEAQAPFKLGGRQRPGITVGRVATWLARDLMRFQYSTLEKSFGKISSSPDFVALQTSLANFDARKNGLLSLFKAAKLIDDRTSENYFADVKTAKRSLHPFLGAVVADANNLRDWKSFYRAYLVHRINWLRSCEAEEFYPARRSLRRSDRRRNTSTPKTRRTVAQQTAERLLKQPINLPRGLFAELVRRVVEERFPKELARATNGGATSTNASWLIARFRDWNGDASQEFYRWRRDYRNVAPFKRLFEICGSSASSTSPLDFSGLKKAFDARFDACYSEVFKKVVGQEWNQCREEAKIELKTAQSGRRAPRNDEIHKLADEKQAAYKVELKRTRRETERAKFRQISSWERDIRHAEIQDYVLAQAASVLLFEGDATKIRLKDVYTLLDETGAYEANPLRKLRPCEVVFETKEGPCKIRGEMNVKNSGNFQRFLTDGRLPSFLLSLRKLGSENAQEISYNDLANEFAASDRVERGRVFDAIYRFEEACFKRYPELREAKSEKGDYVAFRTILERVFENDEETQYSLIVVRNSFMHQEYPIFITPEKADKKRWDPIFDRWNKEMWANYNPKHGVPLCRSVADWAVRRFDEATRRVKSR